MSHYYSVQMHWSPEDGAFLAEVPELPGCVADGKTQEEAIKNLEHVVKDWIATAKSMGREIPQPLDVNALQREAVIRNLEQVVKDRIATLRREIPQPLDANALQVEAYLRTPLHEHLVREVETLVKRIIGDYSRTQRHLPRRPYDPADFWKR